MPKHGQAVIEDKLADMSVEVCMARYFILQGDGCWMIKFRGEIFGPYRTRDEALLFAIDAAQKLGKREHEASVLVEDMKDHFITRWSYGEPPQVALA